MAYKPKILSPTEGGTGSSNTATSGKILIGNGTNFVSSTPTYPNAAGTTGNVLTSDGTNFVSSAAINGYKLLSAQSGAAASTVDFTNISLGTYRVYIIQYRAVVPVTDGSVLWMQMSTDNGATFSTTNYFSGINLNNYNSATVTNTNATTHFLLSPALDNGASTSFACGEIKIYSMSGNLTYIVGSVISFDNTGSAYVFGTFGGVFNVVTANAFRMLLSSGNISNGSFYLYGLQSS